MADKTTTLKTKTDDNVYPNVIGDNRKNAFVDSSTITHHFYDQTHKVGFQIANETNIKIQNSLQKPAGLTKTKLVGVGANGQENIEIGDNLTLANGKLSATGGSDINILVSEDLDIFLNGDQGVVGTYTGNIKIDKINILYNKKNNEYILCNIAGESSLICNYLFLRIGLEQNQIFVIKTYVSICTHFITLTNSADNIVLYLTIQNNSVADLSANLEQYLAGKKILVNGNLHGVVPTYIAGEGNTIKIYYRTPGDNNINPEPDAYNDLSSFVISDDVNREMLWVDREH